MESCVKPQHTWVVAACGGVVSLFEKHPDKHLDLLPQEKLAISPSIEHFRIYMETAAKEAKFNQLILVGAANDIAWVHAALPSSIITHIVAEIQYPLMSSWFRGEAGLPQLTKVLEQVFFA